MTHEPADYVADYRRRIAAALTPDAPKRASRAQMAAVLVPVVEYEAAPRILLTRRADHLDSHSGQVAFPGGKIEAGDASPEAAALREAHEEIGLDARFVEIAGFFEPHETGTGFCILPVVGFVRPGFTLRANRNEVAEIFEVPLHLAVNPASYQRHEVDWQGRRRQYHAFEYEGFNIWGATAAMLRGLGHKAFTETA